MQTSAVKDAAPKWSHPFIKLCPCVEMTLQLTCCGVGEHGALGLFIAITVVYLTHKEVHNPAVLFKIIPHSRKECRI